jgi:molybdenum cofactor cytidylyltransferase
MRAQTVDIREAAGRILSCTIFRASGKKLLAKGHVISEQDVQLLATEGLDKIWVTELEDGEIPEDQAVLAVASEMVCGAAEIRLAPGGRVNLLATEDCCVLLDEDLLRQINCTFSVVIATVTNFSFARAGQRIATVKSAPFAVAQQELEAILSVLHERGPLLQARPIRNPTVGLLYSDPLYAERARQLFENIVRQKLERFGVAPGFTLCAVEEDAPLTRALHHLLRARPTVILVASTTAPAGPSDAIGRALTQVGAQLEKFLAPVEPGNLLLLAYCEDIPIVSAPGCYRSARPNVVDLLLPPLLARYRVSGWEVACLGHGGLLA